MRLEGFSIGSSSITDANGKILLLSDTNTIAASWSFPKLMDHWKRKHSQAVYVPCLRRKLSGSIVEYSYGSNLEFGVGTNFEKFLIALIQGQLYYDPALKLENASDSMSIPKKRNQFRISHKFLHKLYNSFEFLDVAS